MATVPPPAEPRRALITGISGQDGSFLAELLLDKGYAVTGLVHGPAAAQSDEAAATGESQVVPPGASGRAPAASGRAPGASDRARAASGRAPAVGEAPGEAPLGCSEHLREQLTLVSGELLQPGTLRAAIEAVRPHEIYHLAAPSFIPASWERPRETVLAIAGSTAAVLESVRDLDPGPDSELGRAIRVFVPASAAIYGDAPEAPQREDTPCRPTTPYGAARLAAHELVGQLRAHDGLHASSGIVFNHESERRPERFVTRRITRAAAAISLGLRSEVALGDLSAVRDWSFAGDIVYGAWLMLQQDEPGDYVLASGVAHTVADFARVAFACVDLDYERHVSVDASLVRPAETVPSVGDPARARERLGWRPRLGFEELVQRMVTADLRELERVTAGA